MVADADWERLRYQSDVTDEEWRVIELHLPTANTTGLRRAWPLREAASFYIMPGGWRQLPKDFPPWSKAYCWFAAWRDACVVEKIPRPGEPMASGPWREASPSAAIIDMSQCVKTTGAGGPRRYDESKKIKGRKRDALVDTEGSVPNVQFALAPDRLLRASRRLRIRSRGGLCNTVHYASTLTLLRRK